MNHIIFSFGYGYKLQNMWDEIIELQNNFNEIIILSIFFLV